MFSRPQVISVTRKIRPFILTLKWLVMLAFALLLSFPLYAVCLPLFGMPGAILVSVMAAFVNALVFSVIHANTHLKTSANPKNSWLWKFSALPILLSGATCLLAMHSLFTTLGELILGVGAVPHWFFILTIALPAFLTLSFMAYAAFHFYEMQKSAPAKPGLRKSITLLATTGEVILKGVGFIFIYLTIGATAGFVISAILTTASLLMMGLLFYRDNETIFITRPHWQVWPFLLTSLTIVGLTSAYFYMGISSYLGLIATDAFGTLLVAGNPFMVTAIIVCTLLTTFVTLYHLLQVAEMEQLPFFKKLAPTAASQPQPEPKKQKPQPAAVPKPEKAGKLQQPAAVPKTKKADEPEKTDKPQQPAPIPPEQKVVHSSGMPTSFEIEHAHITYTANNDGTPKTLGEGGFGIVYQGTYLFDNVAIKESKLTYKADKVIADFKNEAKILAGLRSEFLVRFYGYCLSPKYCLVMELMPEGSLYNLLQSNKELAWTQRYKIATNIAKGLATLHAQNILHRDIKSLNVLLGKNCHAKLADFGLSRIKESADSATVGAAGTTRWMAPELFKPKAKYGKKSDVYSLGITFYEIASRKTPFANIRDNAAIPSWVARGKRDAIPQACPPKFASLISACWNGENKNRPEAHEIVAFLESSEENFQRFKAGVIPR